MGLAVLGTGIAAGVGGVLLSWLISGVELLAFGSSDDELLHGLQDGSAGRRLLALTAGGLLVGVGWWAYRRFVPFAGTVTGALRDGRLKAGPAVIDAVLQVVGVGVGGSIGKEGAPRLLGAAAGEVFAGRLKLTARQRLTLIGAGAGAGLAAVYQVPFGGALFAAEILLASFALADLVPILVCSVIATLIAWAALGRHPTFEVPIPEFHPALLLAALVLGPLAGLVSRAFSSWTQLGIRLAPNGWRVIPAVTLAFGALGVVAWWFPELLGNGMLAFEAAVGDAGLPLVGLALLLVLKPLFTGICLAATREGGVLMPAVATGALLGVVFGAGWSQLWPGGSVVAFAVIGGAAVLSTTQRAPLCGIVLLLEFTDTGLDLVVPMMIAVGGSLLTEYLLPRSWRPWRARIGTAGD